MFKVSGSIPSSEWGLMSIYRVFLWWYHHRNQIGSIRAYRTCCPSSPTGSSISDLLVLPGLVQTVAYGAVNAYPANVCSSVAKGRTTATRIGQSLTAELPSLPTKISAFLIYFWL